MLEMMHHDTYANLYPMHTFFKSMHCIINFYADALWIGDFHLCNFFVFLKAASESNFN